jgi:hypothetical protein
MTAGTSMRPVKSFKTMTYGIYRLIDRVGHDRCFKHKHERDDVTDIDFSDRAVKIESINAVHEPASILPFGMGLVSLAWQA